jgi:hypothetical protein
MASHHRFPALHNAMWPGLVGKGGPGAEPAIDLDTMLNLTAAAQVNGTRFDGVDLFLFEPHVSIDSSGDDLVRLAEKIGSQGLVVGSLVAPVWPPTGGGSAMGSNGDRSAFLTQVRKACAIGQKLKDLGIRRYGIVRIDSAAGPADWAADPAGDTGNVHQGAQAQSHGQGRARRDRRRERVSRPLRERIARDVRSDALRAATRRSTRSRSTASTRRRSGIFTICIASTTSITRMKGACAAGATSTWPTATSRT